MKISDFNEKVHIGSLVVFLGKARRVEDIDRRMHTALLEKGKMVRCSEFEPYEGSIGPAPVRKKQERARPERKKRPRKRILAIAPDGKEIVFANALKAAKVLPISKSGIYRVLKGESEDVKGYRFVSMD